MRTQSVDTSPEVERVLIGLIREAPLSKRFELVRSWTKSVMQLNQQDIYTHHPNISEREFTLLVLAQNYPQNVVASAEEKLTDTPLHATPDILTTIASLAEIFEQLKITYYIGGSIASSIFGMRQAAKDIDVIAAVKPKHVSALITKLQTRYFVDGVAIKKAIQGCTFFPIIHFDTLLKVDILIPQHNAFEKDLFKRATRYPLTRGAYTFHLVSPEDLLLLRLRRYKQNGENADDQWNDILGIFKVQGNTLDFLYIEHGATKFGVEDLLTRAMADAGLHGGK